MKDILPTTIHVSHSSDAGVARRAARDLAHKLGFHPTATEELVLTVSELTTNLIKHARGGLLTLSAIENDGRTGVSVDAHDEGPGIADVDRVLAPGYSTAGSLGDGLGAVNRLMDEFDIKSQLGQGTRVLCRKWLRRPGCNPTPHCLDIGVASRPHLMEDACGDAFVIKQWDMTALVGVIDGLGHGRHARAASQEARLYVENHFDQPLEEIFAGVDRACRGTRGSVMALARLDCEHERIVCASVGNIEARIHPPSRTDYFQVRRGVMGLNAPRPIVSDHPWPATNVMALFSDGLRQRWTWRDFSGLLSEPASDIAQALLRALARDNDDATVLVVKGVRP